MSDRMTLLVAVLAPAVMVEEVESNVTGRDTDSLQGSDSRPLARQGTVAAALRLIRGEVCDREEWTERGRQIVLSPKDRRLNLES